VTFEGEAAMRLESLAVAKPGPAYPVPMGPDDRGLMVGDWGPMIDMIETDFARGVEVELIASMFHRSVATWGAAIARCVPHRDVVLTGGCFQNAILTELTRATLEASGRRVYSHERIPPGDGGLAVGQLAVAMARCSCDRHNDGG
jgi:hydrogenase maturation protein HypF